jgi:hypothetical protein
LALDEKREEDWAEGLGFIENVLANHLCMYRDFICYREGRL